MPGLNAMYPVSIAFMKSCLDLLHYVWRFKVAMLRIVFWGLAIGVAAVVRYARLFQRLVFAATDAFEQWRLGVDGVTVFGLEYDWTAETVLRAIEFANTVFPVEEGFNLLAAYWGYCVALITYRAIKSWLPTVSG